MVTHRQGRPGTLGCQQRTWVRTPRSVSVPGTHIGGVRRDTGDRRGSPKAFHKGRLGRLPEATVHRFRWVLWR